MSGWLLSVIVIPSFCNAVKQVLFIVHASCSRKEAALHAHVGSQADKIYMIFIVALSGSAIRDGAKKKKKSS